MLRLWASLTTRSSGPKEIMARVHGRRHPCPKRSRSPATAAHRAPISRRAARNSAPARPGAGDRERRASMHAGSPRPLPRDHVAAESTAGRRPGASIAAWATSRALPHLLAPRRSTSPAPTARLAQADAIGGINMIHIAAVRAAR